MINKLILQKGKNYIRPQYIQLSKTSTLKDFRNKLVRVFEYVTNQDNNENEDNNPTQNSKNSNSKQVVKIYKPDNFNKKDLFDLIYSYTNNFQIFNLVGEEINEDENTLIDVRNIFDLNT